MSTTKKTTRKKYRKAVGTLGNTARNVHTAVFGNIRATLMSLRAMDTLPSDVKRYIMRSTLHVPREDLMNVVIFLVKIGETVRMIDHIKLFTKKRTLSLYITGRKTLPREICNIQSLEVLKIRSTYLHDFHTQRLTSLPYNIGDLKNLRELSVVDHELRHIPKSIGNLKKLEYLDFSHNDLRTVPCEIGLLKHLKVMDLTHNFDVVLPIGLTETIVKRDPVFYW